MVCTGCQRHNVRADCPVHGSIALAEKRIIEGWLSRASIGSQLKFWQDRA